MTKNATTTKTYLLQGAFLVSLLFLVLNVPLALGRQENEKKPSAPLVSSSPRETHTEHDGQHDFDFEIGTWKTHLWTLRRPLTDSKEWIESKGIVVVRKVWNGRANLVELMAEGPAGPFEFLNLRLYNPQTHQWSDYFATSNDGTFLKPMIGEFKNGRGEFIFQEKLNSRAMFFRSVLSEIAPGSCRFEDAFSDDGGKTWKVKGIAIDTRVKDESPQQNSDAPKPTPKNASAEHDGQHDFDFEIGTWKTHLWRLVDPLTGSTKWVEYEGTSVVRKIWNGRANLVELEVDGPTGHIEGLNLRLYNPQSRQWSLNFANSRGGTLSPPTIGEFKNGRGEFFSQETLNGRGILVRFVISDMTTDSCRFEQAFSDDGGKTWEVNWIAIDKRVRDEADKASSVRVASPRDSGDTQAETQSSGAEHNGQHDFDFNIGTWTTHVSRLLQPLTGSTTWAEYEGTSVVRKVWNGRASLFELEVDGQGGRIEGMGLRLYNPQSHQWSLNWASSRDGTLTQPAIGEFKNGRGEFLDHESFNDRAIFARNSFLDITPNSSRFEQAFSSDGGKTWETNWVMTFTRAKDEANKAH